MQSLPHPNTPRLSETTSEAIVQSVLARDDTTVFKTSYYSADTNTTPIGCLSNITTTAQLCEALKASTITPVIRNYLGAIDIYQAYDVDTSIPYRVPIEQVKFLLLHKRLPPQTRVRIKYLHGNLFFFLCLEDDEFSMFTSTELTIAYNKQDRSCICIETGSFCFVNSFFLITKYDGVETTISKLLSSQASERIRNLHLLSRHDEDLMDLPL